jgi:hypothetical protein
LLKAIASTDGDFLHGLTKQLVNAGSHRPKADEHGINFMLAVVKGIEPRDEIEAMLAAQMAAVHNATMTFARRLARVENIPQQDSAHRRRRSRSGSQAKLDLSTTGPASRAAKARRVPGVNFAGFNLAAPGG